MELTEIIHAPDEEISAFKPDLIIAGSGYESRSICIPRNFIDCSCKKIVFAFSDLKNHLSRSNNDKFFRNNNYEFIISQGNVSPDYEHIFQKFNTDKLHVVIDISVMTRTWYHSILKYLHELKGFSQVILRIMYCPAVFAKPAIAKKKISLKEISMHDDMTQKASASKRIALIMGLGVEKDVNLFAFEMIKPEITYLLYADPVSQMEYVENVFISNHKIINQIPITHLNSYPTVNTEKIYSMLVNLILPLRQDYKIVIVPQGPKILSLISIIFQISYPDVDIFIPQFKRKQIRDKKPQEKITSLNLKFESA